MKKHKFFIDKTLLDMQELMQIHHHNVFSSAGVTTLQQNEKKALKQKKKECLFWKQKEKKTWQKYLVKMQFDYADTDGK